jgi:hypothetical protein
MLGVGLGFGTSDVAPTFTTCPHCSYLVNGSCLICEPGNPHPGCEGCIGGRPAPSPWWKHEIFLGVALGVAVSVLSAVAVVHYEQHFLNRK